MTSRSITKAQYVSMFRIWNIFDNACNLSHISVFMFHVTAAHWKKKNKRLDLDILLGLQIICTMPTGSWPSTYLGFQRCFSLWDNFLYVVFDKLWSLEGTCGNIECDKKFMFLFLILLFKQAQWDWWRPAMLKTVETAQYLVCHGKCMGCSYHFWNK